MNNDGRVSTVLCSRAMKSKQCSLIDCFSFVVTNYRNDLKFKTNRSGQTVQTQIRLFLEEQTDQGLHCLLFHLHHFDNIPYGLASLFEF